MAGLKHLSISALIERMERAYEGQNLDDETLELTNRLDKRGKDWHFQGLGGTIVVFDRDHEHVLVPSSRPMGSPLPTCSVCLLAVG